MTRVISMRNAISMTSSTDLHDDSDLNYLSDVILSVAGGAAAGGGEQTGNYVT